MASALSARRSPLPRVGISLCVAGIALCLLWAAWHLLVQAVGVRTAAAVTHVDPSAGNKYGRFVCAYTDGTGAAHDLETDNAHFTPRRGDRVFVLYLPKFPSIAEYDSGNSNLMRCGYKVLYAVILLAIAVGIARRDTPRPSGGSDRG